MLFAVWWNHCGCEHLRPLHCDQLQRLLRRSCPRPAGQPHTLAHHQLQAEVRGQHTKTAGYGFKLNRPMSQIGRKVFDKSWLSFSGSSVVHQLKPCEAQRFAWDDPTGVQTLIWSYLERSGELNLLKVPPTHTHTVHIHTKDH